MSATLLIAVSSPAAAELPTNDETQSPSRAAANSRTESVSKDENIINPKSGTGRAGAYSRTETVNNDETISISGIHAEKDQDLSGEAFKSKAAQAAAEKLRGVANLPAGSN